MSPKTRLALGVICVLYGIFILIDNSEWFTVAPYTTCPGWILYGLLMTASISLIVWSVIAICRGKSAGQADLRAIFGMVLGFGIYRLISWDVQTTDYVVGGLLAAIGLAGLLYTYVRSKKNDTVSE